MTRAEKMRKAAELLYEADRLQQEALGKHQTELCHEFFNELQNLADNFEELADEFEHEHDPFSG